MSQGLRAQAVDQAISVSPNILTRILNKDARLERITDQVWIFPHLDWMLLCRKGKSVPGERSVDAYRWSTLKQLKQHTETWGTLPILPEGARGYPVMENIVASAMIVLGHSFFDEVMEKLRLASDKM